jgi:hypothetical protein
MCTPCNAAYNQTLLVSQKEKSASLSALEKDTPVAKECGTCNNGKVVLFYDNFSCGFFPGECKSKYEYFSAPLAGVTKANDAAGGVNGCPGKLCINSSPFTFSVNNGFDRVKYLVYQKEPYNAPKLGAEIVYESIVSVNQTGIDTIPIEIQGTGVTGVSNAPNDPRLCYAGINCLDKDDNMVFDFVLCNESIFAYYERLPLGRTEWGGLGPNYDAWNHLVPVAKRNIADPANDYVKLAIAYNYKENYVRWIVNDEEVYRINRLGFPLDRKYRGLQIGTATSLPDPDTLLRPKLLSYGFGTFSAFANYSPNNPANLQNVGLVNTTNGGQFPTVDPNVTNIDGTLLPSTYLANYGGLTGFTGTNFGQGANLCIKYVSVYLLAPEQVEREFKGLKCCKAQVLESRCCQNTVPGVNASDDLVGTKCIGKIDNCDPCEVLVTNPCCPQPPCDKYVPHPPRLY